jgi:hypothetical protein
MRARLKTRTLGLAGLMALVAMLAVSAVAASSAFANPEWGECTKVKAAPEFKDSLCNEAGRGEFTWKAFATTKAVSSKGRLELTDEKGGVFGEEIKVRCPKNSEAEGIDEGWVGPGSADEVTKITDAAGKVLINCEPVTGICPTPVTAEAIHLPWQTKLEVIGGEIRDVIVSGTGGAPGWKVSCNGTIDTCEGSTNTAVSNVSTGVDLTFDLKSPKVTCSRGGAGMGKVSGTDHVLNPTGVQLSVK